MPSLRRTWSERLIVLSLAALTGGLGAGLYLALSPLAPTGQRNAPAALPDTAARRAPLQDADLKVLWEGLDPAQAIRPPLSGSASEGAQSERMPFIVRGIIYSNSGQSVVFLQIGPKMSLHRKGDVVEGWTVEKIDWESASFRRDDRLERLTLERRGYTEGAVAAIGTDTATSRAAAIGPARETVGAGVSQGETVRGAGPRAAAQRVPSSSPSSRAKSIPKDVDASVAVPRDAVEKARKDPIAAMEGIAVAPVMNRGQMQGVVLNSVPAQSLAARYGFASGDRILAINGVPLDSPARAYELYALYQNSSSVRVTLEREGRQRTVFFYAQ